MLECCFVMFLQDPRANCCPGSETVHVFILRQKIRISSIFLRLHPCHEEKSIKIIKIQYFNWHHILFYVVKFLHLQMLSKEPDLIACLPFCVSFFALFSKQWKHKWSEAVCVPPFSNLHSPPPLKNTECITRSSFSFRGQEKLFIFCCGNKANVTCCLLWAS